MCYLYQIKIFSRHVFINRSEIVKLCCYIHLQFKMDLLKQLGRLIEQATSDANPSPPIPTYQKVLTAINTRVDMPKHTINAISKRLILKNKKVLFYCFDLLQYLSFRVELSFYTQVCTKQFLLKISGLLMNQQIDSSVHTKMLQTIKVWQELFRPYDDLLPMYFQFYAGLLRKDFPIQNGYVSPHRPTGFTVAKKVEQRAKEQGRQVKSKPVVQPTATQQKQFQDIRQQLIVTNEIIDNHNVAENVKSNQILMEMIQAIKKSQHTIKETINGNPTQKIMELAFAVNDDIFITYRRFKDLQKNRKPEPFILTQLASQMMNDQKRKQQIKIQKSIKESSKINEKKEPQKGGKVEQKPKQIDIFDVAGEVKRQDTVTKDLMDLDISSPPPPVQPLQGGDIFAVLGSSLNPSPVPPTSNNLAGINFEQSQPSGCNQPQPSLSSVYMQPQPSVFQSQSSGFQPQPSLYMQPSATSNPLDMIPPGGLNLLMASQMQKSSGITLQTNSGKSPNSYGQLNNPYNLQPIDFATQNDLKPQEKSTIDRLTDFSEFFKK